MNRGGGSTGEKIEMWTAFPKCSPEQQEGVDYGHLSGKEGYVQMGEGKTEEEW